MKISTQQNRSFADAFVPIPENELFEIDSLVDWKPIEKVLSPIATDYRPLSLFKALLLRDWHNLSYEGVSSSLRRDLVFMKFCGFSLEGNKPDATTLERFRDRVIQKVSWEKLLITINQDIEKKGLKVSQGKHVSIDATLIPSARRPKKVYPGEKKGEDVDVEKPEYSDDKEASWKKKGGKSIYGYQGYFAVDTQGMVNSVHLTPAHQSEMSDFPEVIQSLQIEEGTRVLYDKGVDSKKNREVVKEANLLDGIMRKKKKGKEMTQREKQRNRAISKRRYVVERTFGTLKRTYGLARASLIGIVKVQSECLSKAICYNLKRALNHKRNFAF